MMKQWNILNEILNNKKYLNGLKNHPILAESHLMMAHVYANSGDFNEALELLEETVNFKVTQELQEKIDSTMNKLYTLNSMQSNYDDY